MHRWLYGLGLVALVGMDHADAFSQDTLKVVEGSGRKYHLSQQDGEKQLHLLAKSSNLEDNWILSGETWTDVGIHQKLASVKIDSVRFLEDINLPQNSTVYGYHIHPVHARTALFAPPSSIDIIFHAQSQKSLKDRGIFFTSKVCDGYGVWEYTVTDDLANELTSGGNIQHLILKFWLAICAEKFLSADPHTSVHTDTSQYIHHIKIGGVLLSYTSFEERK